MFYNIITVKKLQFVFETDVCHKNKINFEILSSTNLLYDVFVSGYILYLPAINNGKGKIKSKLNVIVEYIYKQKKTWQTFYNYVYLKKDR